MKASDRVAAYRDLLAAAGSSDEPLATWLQPNLERARYRLGTSVADFELPYVVDPSFHHVLDTAIYELALLWTARNEVALNLGADGALSTLADSAKLRPVTYGPPDGLKDPVLRAVLARAPRILPHLDSGIMASWLGSGGHGRELVSAWAALLVAAAGEMAGADGEETVIFAHWAVANCFARAATFARSIPVSESTAARLVTTLLVGMHLAHHVVRAQVRHECPAVFAESSRQDIFWSALLSTRLPFVLCKEKMGRCGFYDLSSDCLGSRKETLVNKLARGAELKTIAATVKEMLGRDRAAREAALPSWLRARFETMLVDTLATSTVTGDPTARMIHAWLSSPETLDQVLDDGQQRKTVSRELHAASKDPIGSPVWHSALEKLAGVVNAYDPERPHRTFRMNEDQCLGFMVLDVLADLGDSLVAKLGEPAAARLRQRSGTEREEGLRDEYEAGKLYWFGRSGEPILQAGADATDVAHYFVDLKDYTKRTALLKEDVMAEFIRREFYLPILSIASKESERRAKEIGGARVLLNALLGDAVSFSGEVVALINITRSIRHHLETYAEALSARARQDELAVRNEEVHEEYAKRLSALEQQRTEARAELEAARALLESSGEAGASQVEMLAHTLSYIDEELARTKSAKENELAYVTGQHLISGSFITYGASPAVILLEDPEWGQQSVSISEKINEGARGTSRVGGVIAGFRAQLDIERKRLGIPSLELPFRVYVGNTLGLPLTPEAELALRDAFRAGDTERTFEIYSAAVKDHVTKTVSGGSKSIERYLHRGVGLYNSGDAVSGEALTAYRQAMSAKYRFVDLEIPTESLDQKLRARFAFFVDALRLVVVAEPGGAVEMVFRYAGSMTFKGFEEATPTEVWELVDPSTLVGGMLKNSSAVLEALG